MQNHYEISSKTSQDAVSRQQLLPGKFSEGGTTQDRFLRGNFLSGATSLRKGFSGGNSPRRVFSGAACPRKDFSGSRRGFSGASMENRLPDTFLLEPPSEWIC